MFWIVRHVPPIRSSAFGIIIWIQDKMIDPNAPKAAENLGPWCEDQVTAFYRARQLFDKLEDVDELCAKYQGREKLLLNKIRHKYSGKNNAQGGGHN